jgi:hypothetical protein
MVSSTNGRTACAKQVNNCDKFNRIEHTNLSDRPQEARGGEEEKE